MPKKKKLKALNARLSRARVEEEQFKEIASLLSQKVWKKFARQIGVRDQDLDDLAVTHRGDPEEARYQMIRKWHEISENPTYGCLCMAAKQHHQSRIYELLVSIASRTESRRVEASADSPGEPHGSDHEDFRHGYSSDDASDLGQNFSTQVSTSAQSELTHDSDSLLSGAAHSTPHVLPEMNVSNGQASRDRPELLHSQSDSTPASSRSNRADSPHLIGRCISEPVHVERQILTTRSRRSTAGPTYSANGSAVMSPLKESSSSANGTNFEQQSIDELTKQAEKVFDVSGFIIKAFVKLAKSHRDLTGAIVFALFICQVIAIAYRTYNLYQEHSSGDPLAYVLPLALLVITTCVFPAALVFVFSRVLNPAASDEGDKGLGLNFMMEMVHESNRSIVTDWLKSYTADESEEKCGNRVHTMRNDIERELQYSCFSVVLQAVSVAILSGLCVLWSNSSRSQVSGLYSICCIGLECFMQAFLGVMFTFYFRDLKICNRVQSLIDHCLKQNESESLVSSSQKVNQCLTQRWHVLGVICSYMTVAYFTVAILSWCSGNSLSAGAASVSMSHPFIWITAIGTLSATSLLVSTPCPIGLSRFVMPIVQTVVLCFFSRHSGAAEESAKILQLLHLILPLYYIVYYAISDIYYKPTLQKASHSCCHAASRSRMWSSLGLLILVALTAAAFVRVEYAHTGLSKDPVTKDCHFAEDSYDHLLHLARAHCIFATDTGTCQRNEEEAPFVLDRYFSSNQKCVLLHGDDLKTVQKISANLKASLFAK